MATSESMSKQVHNIKTILNKSSSKIKIRVHRRASTRDGGGVGGGGGWAVRLHAQKPHRDRTHGARPLPVVFVDGCPSGFSRTGRPLAPPSTASSLSSSSTKNQTRTLTTKTRARNRRHETKRHLNTSPITILPAAPLCSPDVNYFPLLSIISISSSRDFQIVTHGRSAPFLDRHAIYSFRRISHNVCYFHVAKINFQKPNTRFYF